MALSDAIMDFMNEAARYLNPEYPLEYGEDIREDIIEVFQKLLSIQAKLWNPTWTPETPEKNITIEEAAAKLQELIKDYEEEPEIPF